MNTCFNCGSRYNQIDGSDQSNMLFCSNECEAEDTARLIEGNGIITAAEKQEVGFTDINKLKLDTNMPLAAKALQDLKEKDKQQLNNLLGFNRQNRSNINDNENKDSL